MDTKNLVIEQIESYRNSRGYDILPHNKYYSYSDIIIVDGFIKIGNTVFAVYEEENDIKFMDANSLVPWEKTYAYGEHQKIKEQTEWLKEHRDKFIIEMQQTALEKLISRIKLNVMMSVLDSSIAENMISKSLIKALEDILKEVKPNINK